MVKHVVHKYKFENIHTTYIYIFIRGFHDKIQKRLVNHSRFILVA